MTNIEKYWNDFILTKPEYHGKKYSAWFFGYEKDMANNLAELVFNGEKTGTSSLELGYVIDDEELPTIGDISIITDFDDNPKCIIKNVKVSKLKFKDITVNHAILEGEGDKTLKYWQDNHKDFFEKEAEDLGASFSTDLHVVFEEFVVIYK